MVGDSDGQLNIGPVSFHDKVHTVIVCSSFYMSNLLLDNILLSSFLCMLPRKAAFTFFLVLSWSA